MNKRTVEKVLAIAVCTYILNAMVWSCATLNSTKKNKVQYVKTVTEQKDTIYHVVTATYYNPVESQCDDDPLITANNSKIDLDELNKQNLRWVALSRDLLNEFSYGDTIMVQSDYPRLNGKWVVMDTMHKRFSNHIDFLAPLECDYGLDKPSKIKISKL